MREPIDIHLYRIAYECYEIAHKCGTCVSSEPSLVKTEKLRLIGEAIERYMNNAPKDAVSNVEI